MTYHRSELTTVPLSSSCCNQLLYQTVWLSNKESMMLWTNQFVQFPSQFILLPEHLLSAVSWLHSVMKNNHCIKIWMIDRALWCVEAVCSHTTGHFHVASSSSGLSSVNNNNNRTNHPQQSFILCWLASLNSANKLILSTPPTHTHTHTHTQVYDDIFVICS